MSYILYGSQTSPFVRRIRILMEHLSYEFREMNIFAEHAEELNKINPINQIPVLVDGEVIIWDSRQIFNYLNAFHRFQNMDWEDENKLTAIDGAMNSAVSILLMQRSGINTTGPLMYAKRQIDRIESILDFLEPYIQDQGLKEWNFHSISIYCFLDWAQFRGLIDLTDRSGCIEFLKNFSNKEIVQKTAIPKG
jgi:glutathione S-transferase